MNKDLIENWNLRNTNYDKNVLLATILNKGASFGCLYEDPMMFKYMCDYGFWNKHYRTFEKWFTAFDIPYSPLENYNRKDVTLGKVNETGNTFNRHTDTEDNTSTHIGDKFSNEDLSDRTTNDKTSNEVWDQDTTTNITTQEVTDDDTTGSKSSTENTTTHDEGTKGYTDLHTLERDKTTATATDITETTTDNDRTTTENPNLTEETRVSAFNEGGAASGSNPDDPNYGNYSPHDIVISKGAKSTVGTGSTSVNTKTNGQLDDDKNKVHEIESVTEDDHTYDESTTNDGTKGVIYSESTTGTDDKTVDFTSSEVGTNDHTTDFTSNEIGTDTRNVKTTGNEKSMENSISKASGDSETKTTNDKDYTNELYAHGNIGTMTSQQMLKSEIQVQLFTIYDQIAELFCNEMCVRIYLSNRQRGGCWCDY